MAAMNTPLAMIVTGYYLVGTRIKACITDPFAWLTVLLRQAALPILLMLLYRYAFGIGGMLLMSAVLPVAAPCAVIVIMFSAAFGGDEKTATQLVSLSTVTAILSMPLVLIVSQLIK